MLIGMSVWNVTQQNVVRDQMIDNGSYGTSSSSAVLLIF